ncbi:hypothetical protein T4A_6735 [Trichinella pseudospiralis]|uniref:Uncharacterized protein n=1 Tax=Trichinella pseudospiralis TaxID=6337 RepID=A0A0V1DPU6_TRIPS|nr:hypothetical protein T4A_6735 [Trichinella pseudospiralis]
MSELLLHHQSSAENITRQKCHALKATDIDTST